MPFAIEVHDVCKAFQGAAGRLAVVEGARFAVAEGEFVAIVGPSGCGKTTLLNIIAGFERADAGRVLVGGAEPRGPSPRAIVISQQGSVFPWLTVRGNLTFGLQGRADAAALADRYAALVGLAGFEDAYAHELSGGMVKRVEIARALIVKPDVLYMDEPLSALDALTSLRMRTELLRIFAEERHTCLLVTHNVEEAIHMADRILVLSPRPARVQAVFEVAEPQPRRISSPALQALKDAILRELGL
jgi:ABC-type nitrate/sulfonate/bicarbonate transport system ATPase subunit